MSSSQHPMCRSFSAESHKKDWCKRLSLRGNPRSKEVFFILFFLFFNSQWRLTGFHIVITSQILSVIQNQSHFLGIFNNHILNYWFSFLIRMFGISFVLRCQLFLTGKRCEFSQGNCTTFNLITTVSITTNLTRVTSAIVAIAPN